MLFIIIWRYWPNNIRSNAKIKDNNKKRIASVSPVKAIKTKILGDKRQSTRKITFQEGDDFQPQTIKLNLVKVDLRKASIEQ